MAGMLTWRVKRAWARASRSQRAATAEGIRRSRTDPRTALEQSRQTAASVPGVRGGDASRCRCPDRSSRRRRRAPTLQDARGRPRRCSSTTTPTCASMSGGSLGPYLRGAAEAGWMATWPPIAQRAARSRRERRHDAGTRWIRASCARCAPIAAPKPCRSFCASARAGEEATLEGLDAGADDYLVKPFSARELLARVRTQLEIARVRRGAAERTRLLREAEAARAAAEAANQLQM